MYHHIVGKKVRHAFAEINAGRFDSALQAFSGAPRHVFFGRHAMGGVREGMEQTRQWYERLHRLIPDLQFQVHRVLVRGWPWSTEIMAEWSDSFMVDGEPVTNHGVHRMLMRWGKVTELAIYCDTQRLAEVLRRKALAGNAEAIAPEIGSPAP